MFWFSKSVEKSMWPKPCVPYWGERWVMHRHLEIGCPEREDVEEPSQATQPKVEAGTPRTSSHRASRAATFLWERTLRQRYTCLWVVRYSAMTAATWVVWLPQGVVRGCRPTWWSSHRKPSSTTIVCVPLVGDHIHIRQGREKVTHQQVGCTTGGIACQCVCRHHSWYQKMSRL